MAAGGKGIYKARAALAWLGRGELALPTRLVARVSGFSSVSVVRFLERGHAAFHDRGIQPAELLIPAFCDIIYASSLFLIDEFAEFGQLASIEEGISIMLGYGGMLWLLVQDLSQLRVVYAKCETFLANTVPQAFGTQDQATVQYLSDVMGTEAVVQYTQTKGESSREPILITSDQHHWRAVLMQDDIRRLSGLLVLQQGRFPHSLGRTDYRQGA